MIVESCFLSREADGDYIIYYVKARDLEYMREVSKKSTLEVDRFNEEFKQKVIESRMELEVLTDFDRLNRSTSFSGD